MSPIAPGHHDVGPSPLPGADRNGMKDHDTRVEDWRDVLGENAACKELHVLGGRHIPTPHPESDVEAAYALDQPEAHKDPNTIPMMEDVRVLHRPRRLRRRRHALGVPAEQQVMWPHVHQYPLPQTRWVRAVVVREADNSRIAHSQSRKFGQASIARCGQAALRNLDHLSGCRVLPQPEVRPGSGIPSDHDDAHSFRSHRVEQSEDSTLFRLLIINRADGVHQRHRIGHNLLLLAGKLVRGHIAKYTLTTRLVPTVPPDFDGVRAR